MFNIDELFNKPPYELKKEEKEKVYKEALMELTEKHYKNCLLYKNMIDNFSFHMKEEHPTDKYPFLPVRLFKEYDLCSMPPDDIVKTMTSSGTSGQQVSRIYLDKTTSANQTKTLVKITSDFLGKKRLPMLIIDCKSVVKDRKLFSARGSGILGFSMMGYDTTYALDENMLLDYKTVEAFLEKHRNEDIFLFGFTFIIWEHLYKYLNAHGRKLDLSRGILIHGGGFKKLMEEAVDNDTYKTELEKVCGIKKVFNYYGMVEQTGSIFMECECGRLHASNFSDVIIRNPNDFSICKAGEKGLIELISILPESYPGHCILSEDIGEIIGEDDCPCGRYGKTFKIHGRIKQAEVRGCSDTYDKK
jgi:phenylacetate-coenzyme A ligase PaaK-like adenylate-forming protein